MKINDNDSLVEKFGKAFINILILAAVGFLIISFSYLIIYAEYDIAKYYLYYFNVEGLTVKDLVSNFNQVVQIYFLMGIYNRIK